MTGHLGQLAGKYNGPVLVTGGGMQALNDYAQVKDKKWAAVISANGHGFKIPGLAVDFIVCKDNLHSQNHKPMRDLLEPYEKPIISRHWWADYRIADWELPGTSGLMAIAVAAVLGATEIYPIGFDFYRDGTYWHAPAAKNVSRGKRTYPEMLRVERILSTMHGVTFCPLSGPMLKRYRAWGRDTPYSEPAILREYREKSMTLVETTKNFSFSFDRAAQCAAGTRFWVSDEELTREYQSGSIQAT